MHFRSLLLAAIAATASFAHPGHDITVEALERRTFLQSTKRDLSHCSAKLEARGIIDRAIARRAEFGRRHAKRSWSPRQVRGGSQSHESTADYTIDTPIGTIFGTNNTCILKPEATEGPYYVAGEHIRADITNQQAGVPFHLDVQVLDVETCEPVEKAYIEIWHCNSTGVYSGVTANGNGVAEDLTNLDNTAFRGIQLSDDDGVAQFSSKFPGHYTGRATHIHVMVHVNATAQTNGTINNLVASHVGQVYFDQDLIHRVEKEAVYLTNQQPLTLNSNDFLLKAENGSDPFVNYDLLGDAIADGLLGWITIAVNRTNEATRKIYNAATLTKDGGVRNPNGFPPPPPGGISPPQ